MGILDAMMQQKPTTWQRTAAVMKWTRSSYFLMSAFLATLLLISVLWWPLVEDSLALYDHDRPFWVQTDWLLIGNFLVMSVLIMAGADLKRDAFIALLALGGGLAIEGWGTQTDLWKYFTVERPPLWIIPAWPIANLSVVRLVRLLQVWIPEKHTRVFTILYWVIFPAFYVLMLVFVWPYADKSLTILALVASALMIVTPTDHRYAVLTFVAGSVLGYFLELWGTTRYCWMYYTQQTPPPFTVLAHGMAAVAFWRSGLLVKLVLDKWIKPALERIRGGRRARLGALNDENTDA